MADGKNSEFPLHVDRYHLPEPEWTCPDAEINLYAQDAEPDLPLALLDELGFGWPSVNGGLVEQSPLVQAFGGRHPQPVPSRHGPAGVTIDDAVATLQKCLAKN